MLRRFPCLGRLIDFEWENYATAGAQLKFVRVLVWYIEPEVLVECIPQAQNA
jgi:hypothetical protein